VTEDRVAQAIARAEGALKTAEIALRAVQVELRAVEAAISGKGGKPDQALMGGYRP